MRSTKSAVGPAALALMALLAGCKDGMSDPTARDPTPAEKAAKAQRADSSQPARLQTPLKPTIE